MGAVKESLSESEARRVALAAQRVPRRARSARPSKRTVLDLVRRQGVLQIDSVNVLARAQYLPVFSRLGAYDREVVDRLAYRDRSLYEAWSHEACFVPVELWPLHAWRRAAMETMWRRYWAESALEYVDKVYAEVLANGPMSAAELSDVGAKRAGTWWNRSSGKSALEFLFACGRVSVADRRGFERVYDVTERVLPADVLAAPVPSDDDARRALLLRAARSVGVGTVADLADYWRMKVTVARAIVRSLVAEGELVQVAVEGWKDPAFVLPDVSIPRRVDGRCLLSPFDPVVWFRPRTERLFGFHYRIEIYVPAAKRVHGYYVLPFLIGDQFAARVDLKADRAAGVLRVFAAWEEPCGLSPVEVARELAEELGLVASWLGLDGGVDVADRGDLAGPLAAAVGAFA
ncbi:MAG TPA: crosslink repair DNA glycosylase YcaQ family protein [Acidimicrobiales bacterium]